MDRCSWRLVSWYLGRPLSLFVGVTLLAALVLVLTSNQLHGGRTSHGKSMRGPYPDSQMIHIALCSDDTDLRPAAAAIRSAWMSSSEPERIVFHYITTPEYAPLFGKLFKAHLPEIHIEVHHDQRLQSHIKSLISFRDSSHARKILASPFNFAPFYLPDFVSGRSSGKQWLNLPRMIYLDTDVLVLGDVKELWNMDLQGHACAAVKYCLQHWDDYINFEVLKDLGYYQYNPKECIANRGVVVIDVPRWKQSNLTGKIEQWMVHYRNSPTDLWIGGMSQPPWLLAMNSDFLSLSDDWNCNSLGRADMHPREAKTLRQAGFDHKALKALSVTYSRYGSILPYVVTCSATAKLLHYNGAVKPWLTDMIDAALPTCAVPQKFDPNHKFQWSRTVKVFCEDQDWTRCAEIWHYYISESAECALKDFDKEWTDDEEKWAKNYQQDTKTVSMSGGIPNSEAQTGERFKRDKEEQEKQDKIAARKIKRLEREEKKKRDNEELQRRLPQDAGDGQR